MLMLTISESEETGELHTWLEGHCLPGPLGKWDCLDPDLKNKVKKLRRGDMQWK